MPLIIINGTVRIIRMPKSYLGVPKNPQFKLRVFENPKVGLGLIRAYIQLNDEFVKAMRYNPYKDVTHSGFNAMIFGTSYLSLDSSSRRC